ncbi:MAG TPA: CZB domain-containing protein, partial [Gammaproteobacteria bacterium]
KWKVRLTDYIEGKSTETLDPQVIACDDRCDLGKWIYANLDHYQHNATFVAVRNDHAEFHKAAAGIVELCHAGNRAMASSSLYGPYSTISRKVIAGIVRLGQEVEDQAPVEATLR